MVFIFPSRAGGSWQAFTQTLDSAQQGGQYSHWLLAIGLLQSHERESDWSVGTPPPRLCSAVPFSSLKAFCACMWSFVLVGECVWVSANGQGACLRVQSFSYVSGAPWVHGQRVSWEYDPRDSGHLPENGPSPKTLWVQAGQDHCQAAAPEEDLWR